VKKKQETVVNLPLPVNVHAAAKAKAALSQKSLVEWLAERIAEVVK
jgi:predicted HicB family RNase H-like nuclease